MDYANLLKDFGPAVGVILFFIWRDWKREDWMASRIAALEDFQQHQLIDLIERTHEVVNHNTEQLKRVAALVQRCQGHDQPA